MGFNVFTAFNERLLKGISMTMLQLPGDVLQKFKSEITNDSGDLNRRFRLSLAHELVAMNNVSEEIGYASFVSDSPICLHTPEKKSNEKYKIIFPQFFSVWKSCEIIAFLNTHRGIFELLNGNESGFIKKYNEYICEVYDNCRLPLNQMTRFNSSALTDKINENNNTALAGITVEFYRRKYGKLPESFDVLVPEFLDSVPFSQYNDEPLVLLTGECKAFKGRGKKYVGPELYTLNGYVIRGSVIKEDDTRFIDFAVVLERQSDDDTDTNQ